MRKSNLEQNGLVIWFTGLSGAGKSTLSSALEVLLNQNGFFTISLDGDVIRSGMNKDLGFSKIDRSENIRRVQEMSKILVQKNIIVLCSFITPDQQYRDENRKILGNQYYEVFVDCPVSVCELRDVKGLYQRARNQEIDFFTGVNAGFDKPLNPDLILDTYHQTLQVCVETLFSSILPLIKITL